MTAPVPTSSGLQFPPTPNGKAYISLYAHRRVGVLMKSMWHPSVAPQTEYSIFCSSDAGNWRSPDGNYWGIGQGGNLELGTQGQRLCKFPKTSNQVDPWHGYPVSPSESEYDTPPFEFVEAWISESVVSKTFGRRIQRRKL